MRFVIEILADTKHDAAKLAREAATMLETGIESGDVHDTADVHHRELGDMFIRWDTHHYDACAALLAASPRDPDGKGLRRPRSGR